MWKLLFESVLGSSHRAAQTPCQDSCAAAELRLADEHVAVLACSDGAGSAAHAEIGSRLACDAVVRCVSEQLAGRAALEPLERDAAQRWHAAALASLKAEASRHEIAVKELACTLLVAVVGRRGAAFSQIGDGAIVCRSGADYRHVFWPQAGEYANVTWFLTSPGHEERLAFEWRDESIDEIAIFSDGLQMVALDFARQEAHQGFFAPLFSALRECPDPALLAEPLRAFLSSERLAERTDDDKTLILAVRAQPDAALL